MGVVCYSARASGYSTFAISSGNGFFCPSFLPSIVCCYQWLPLWLRDDHCSQNSHPYGGVWEKGKRQRIKKRHLWLLQLFTRSVSSLRQILADFTLCLTDCDWFTWLPQTYRNATIRQGFIWSLSFPTLFYSPLTWVPTTLAFSVPQTLHIFSASGSLPRTSSL